MKVVEADEAQINLRKLLAEVEDGATITIVEDGSARAQLVPVPATPKPGLEVGRAIDE
jgi:antitoxin (DNA-binding transcriptional repressor) of toxin-antitoxin stability system